MLHIESSLVLEFSLELYKTRQYCISWEGSLSPAIESELRQVFDGLDIILKNGFWSLHAQEDYYESVRIIY